MKDTFKEHDEQNTQLVTLDDKLILENQHVLHEAVFIMPKMKAQDYEDLKSDISKNGLQIPILRYQGKILDGRHRLQACNELGITPHFSDLPEAANDSPEQIVISLNLHRRHLSETERAMIGARTTNSALGTNQHTAGAVSQKQVAEDLGISVDSIQRAKKVINQGVPELIKAVEAGKIDISNAAKLASLEQEEQLQINFDDLKAIQQLSKAINKAKFEGRRIERIQEIEAKRANNKPLESELGKHSVLYVDPPWDYMGEMEVGYPCMKLQEIKDMPIKNICEEDAVLFMWCSSSLLGEALEVIGAWGFKFKTSAIWDKGTAGQGPYFRQAHEVLMIATKGKVPEVNPSGRPSSVLKYPRREHSRKPEELYQIIDGMYPELSKIELFCRGEPAEGWSGWGNECTQQSSTITSKLTSNTI